MSIIINNAHVKAVYRGDTPIKSVYRGDDLIWKRSRLPPEYQEVEWIKSDSDGLCCINTQIMPGTECKIALEMKYETIPTESKYIAGSNSTYRFNLRKGGNDQIISPMVNNATGGIHRFADVNANSDEWHTVVMVMDYDSSYASIDVDGNLIEADISPNHTVNVVYRLFNYNSNTAAGLGDLSIRHFRMTQHDETVCELIPCYRVSDGEIGMYDIIRNLFFANVNTGEFSKGSNV